MGINYNLAACSICRGQSGARLGIPPFGDGVDRKMPLMLAQDSLLYPSLALNAVSLLKNDRDISFDREQLTVTTTSDTWSVDKNANIVVNFSDSIPYFELSDVFTS